MVLVRTFFPLVPAPAVLAAPVVTLFPNLTLPAAHPREYYGYSYKLLTAQGGNAPGEPKAISRTARWLSGLLLLPIQLNIDSRLSWPSWSGRMVRSIH